MARRNNGMNWRRLFFWLAILALAGLLVAGTDRASLVAFILGNDVRNAIGLAGFGLALVATTLAWLAWRQRNQLRREVSALQAAVARVMNERSTPVAARTDDDWPPAPAAAISPGPLPWHAITNATPPPRAAAGVNGAAVAGRLRALLDREMLPVSLRPIISLDAEGPVAYDAFVRIEADDDATVDMRRLTILGDAPDAARFERLAIIASMKAVRRLGDGATVHASASAALLSNPSELQRVVEAAAAHPRAARGVALDLALQDARRPGPHADAIDRLESAGLAIGLDFATATDPVVDDWPRLGIGHARIPAAMLLGHRRHRHMDIRAFVGLCRRNDIAIIADDIDGEEALVTIAESGIDLVTGELFGGPRAMRQAVDGGAAFLG